MKQWNAQAVRHKSRLFKFILNKNSLYLFIYLFILIGTVHNCVEHKMAVNVCHSISNDIVMHSLKYKFAILLAYVLILS